MAIILLREDKCFWSNLKSIQRCVLLSFATQLHQDPLAKHLLTTKPYKLPSPRLSRRLAGERGRG